MGVEAPLAASRRSAVQVKWTEKRFSHGHRAHEDGAHGGPWRWGTLKRALRGQHWFSLFAPLLQLQSITAETNNILQATRIRYAAFSAVLFATLAKFTKSVIFFTGSSVDDYYRWESFYYGQFYSHAYVNTRETWTHGIQPNAFYVRGDLNARETI